jgi:hypothetical protein
MSDINIQTFSGKVQVNNNLKVGSGHLFVDTANNQVGLNTTNPLANLHVNGNTYVHSDLRVGSGIVMDQKVATFGTTKTFVVEVVGGVFQIDGVSRPALTFHESQTYIFDQSHVSNTGHPIAFAEAVNGGTPYATGVTSVGTPGQAGAKTTFKVSVGAPSNLFYYCVNHPSTMGSLAGTPSVVSTEAEIIVSGRLLATSIHGDGSALVNIPSSAINGTLSQWTDVNANEIYYDLGNVGIGNQNPNSTLDVTGTGSFSGDLTVGTDKFFVDVSTGQVGVGTTTPAAGKALDVIGDLRATYLYGDGSNINNITSSQWVTTGNDIYYDTGSVRVGSAQAPTETLDVTGTSAFSDDLTVGTSKLVVDVSESRVGVNKAAPGYTLDVLGDINFTGDIRKGGVVQTFGGGGSGSGGGAWTEISGTTTNIHYSAGNVGISNNNPQHTLSVGDNLYVEDAGSNVLVIDGNVACNQVTLGQFEIVPSYGLDDVTAESNVTTDTVELNNVTTGLSTVSNVAVGGELAVTGNVVVSKDLTVTEELVASANVVVSGFVGTSGTGALTVPSGTTEQLPSTGLAVGMIRFNTTVNKLQVYNGTVWQSIGGISATGGTVTEVGGYRIHTFTSDGTFTVISGGDVDYLVVAGGGGGGGSAGSGASGAGGGAGGMLASSTTISASTFAITVGAGGGGAGGNVDTQGTNGSNSSFSTFIATGGGGGGARSSTTTVANGRTGGSGGGEGSQGSSVSNYGSGISGQGNRGGLNGMPSDGNTSNENASGGGGGAGAVGGDGLDSALGGSGSSGNGGIGLQSSISGTSTYYAGGGGGGQAGRNSPYNNLGYAANNSVPETHGAGGLGGGGGGGHNDVATLGGADGTLLAGEDGTPNTGGGGGGAGSFGASGAGGSGIVIIRYLM